MGQKKRMQRQRDRRYLKRIRERSPPSLMDRTKAAVCYINTSRLGRDDPTALVAFMALFHPDYPDDKLRGLIMDRREQNERRRL